MNIRPGARRQPTASDDTQQLPRVDEHPEYEAYARPRRRFQPPATMAAVVLVGAALAYLGVAVALPAMQSGGSPTPAALPAMGVERAETGNPETDHDRDHDRERDANPDSGATTMAAGAKAAGADRAPAPPPPSPPPPPPSPAPPATTTPAYPTPSPPQSTDPSPTTGSPTPPVPSPAPDPTGCPCTCEPPEDPDPCDGDSGDYGDEECDPSCDSPEPTQEPSNPAP